MPSLRRRQKSQQEKNAEKIPSCLISAFGDLPDLIDQNRQTMNDAERHFELSSNGAIDHVTSLAETLSPYAICFSDL